MRDRNIVNYLDRKVYKQAIRSLPKMS